MEWGSEQQQLLERLLQYDLNNFAKILGYRSSVPTLADEDVVRLLNLAETLSRRADNYELRTKCLYICGLLWEHRKSTWEALPAFLVQVLGRLGLQPTTQMVDSDFDRDRNIYSPLGSLFAELKFAKDQLSFEVDVAKRGILLLSAFQRDVWEKIERYGYVGISAPTSAGKSYVLVHKIVEIIARRPCDVLYVVPTLSLIHQVTSDFREALHKYGLESIQVAQTYSTRRSEDNVNTIYVLTQERALSALEQPDAFANMDVFIVDEVQNVERVTGEDDERARTMRDVIDDVLTSIAPRVVVLSGPSVENIAQLTKTFLGNDAVTVMERLPSVVNLTYSHAKKGKQLLLRQHSGMTSEPLEVTIEQITSVPASIFGRQRYDNLTFNFIHNVLQSLGNAPSIVFSPTSRQATVTAKELSVRMETDRADSMRNHLAEYLSTTVHTQYSLIACVRRGIGYHHGKMPRHVRIAIEDAFKDGSLKTIACTTTLMQGVNLPAKNLIVRNPHLFIQRSSKRPSVSLTEYEFANLRGRAGRLMRDLIGRAIVLDENTFDSEQLDLGAKGNKTVETGYGERFKQNQNEISAALFFGMHPDENASANDIVVHIRQSILKYGRTAFERLAQSGIDITEQDFIAARSELERLEVPPDLCATFRYWDPLALNELYRANQRGDVGYLPTNPFENGFVDKLFEALRGVRRFAPYYYNSYFGVSNDRFIMAILITAEAWCREDSLPSIIDYEKLGNELDSEILEERLKTLQNCVGYQLPKVLRPLAHFQNPDNSILSFIELGACKPATRRLIQLGLPRETSVRIVEAIEKYNILGVGQDSLDDQMLVDAIIAVSSQLFYWEKLQVKDILGLKLK